ncbi:hypothetical protein [Thermococcus sp. 9N3]|uniref:hypothetical protein n=1 Tax=Thermococcus sp. 9N3 TaxID=163002 RepID=UPI001430D3D3|nr:hypothetical protein [Thermococcus sp. 9N3]
MIVRRALLLIAIILVSMFLPFTSAQFGTISVAGSITVVRGDYSEGTLLLTNNAGVIYSVVSYQSFWVEDTNGNRVEGFNFTMFPRVFPNWGRGQNKTVKYNLTVSKDVLPGNYTLYLRFIATYSGDVYILKAKVPVEVLASPLTFTSAYSYVPGRGDVPYVFLGESVTVYSHVINIGHFNATVNVFSALLLGSNNYSVVSKNVTVPPGDTLIRLSLPVGWNYPEGNYTLIYRVSYGDQSYTYTKKLAVSLGVRLVGVSVEKESVLLNDTLKAYVTIISERDINATISCVAVINGTKSFAAKTREITLSPGTSVVQLSLPTSKPGNVSAVIGLSVHGRSGGNDTVHYTVYAPPSIGSLSAKLLNSTLEVSALLLNPTPEAVSGTLEYKVLANGTSLYADVLDVTIPPGKKGLSFRFNVPKGVNVTYSFKLNALGRVSVKEGSLWVPAPKPKPSPTQTPTTTSTTPQSNTTSTTGEANGGGFPWWPVVGILIVVAVVVVLYYQNQPKKGRTRKTPKRRSPLGRFKRPKPPKFHERDSLPKKK